MREIKKLSLVIPVYKQEKTVKDTLHELEKTLQSLAINYELLFVVDGFDDNSFQKLKRLAHAHIRVLGYQKNEGKGFAVRYGMLQATGDVIGFIDGDLDIDPTGISMLLNHMIWYDADIIVGSKLHPVSQVQYPLYRRVLSRGYRLLIRMLFGLKVKDTQVGIKLFRREVVQDVFPRLLVKRFAFDIEILAVAYSLGYQRIYEGPIKLNFRNVSSITSKKLWTVIYHMIWDTMAVFYRLKIVHYYDKKRAEVL